jgi:hypothetical protein
MVATLDVTGRLAIALHRIMAAPTDGFQIGRSQDPGHIPSGRPYHSCSITISYGTTV